MLSADTICSAFRMDDALRSKPHAWPGILKWRTHVELGVSQAWIGLGIALGHLNAKR